MVDTFRRLATKSALAYLGLMLLFFAPVAASATHFAPKPLGFVATENPHFAAVVGELHTAFPCHSFCERTKSEEEVRETTTETTSSEIKKSLNQKPFDLKTSQNSVCQSLRYDWHFTTKAISLLLLYHFNAAP
jgi:hypothetical protein